MECAFVLGGLNAYIERKLLKAVKSICSLKCSGVRFQVSGQFGHFRVGRAKKINTLPESGSDTTTSKEPSAKRRSSTVNPRRSADRRKDSDNLMPATVAENLTADKALYARAGVLGG